MVHAVEGFLDVEEEGGTSKLPVASGLLLLPLLLLAFLVLVRRLAAAAVVADVVGVAARLAAQGLQRVSSCRMASEWSAGAAEAKLGASQLAADAGCQPVVDEVLERADNATRDADGTMRQRLAAFTLPLYRAVTLASRHACGVTGVAPREVEHRGQCGVERLATVGEEEW